MNMPSPGIFNLVHKNFVGPSSSMEAKTILEGGHHLTNKHDIASPGLSKTL